MALRPFAELSYIPLLTITVAEMRALEELPERDKDLLLPYFQMRPWGVSRELDNTLERLADAYGDRPFLGDICAATVPDGEPRPVHRRLEELRRSAGGYQAWCEMVETIPHLIPTLQLNDLTQLDLQTDRLWGLGRGLAVYLPRQTFARLGDISARVAARTDNGNDVCVLLDLGQRGNDLLGAQATTVGLVRSIWERMPNAIVAVSASSFPSDFVGVAEQAIFERAHFEGVANELGRDQLVYSDRGSARAERQMGGGGTPAPRVDVPQASRWRFFRDSTGGDRSGGYAAQASEALKSRAVDRDLRVWGVQMIERTAGGDRNAIKSPTSSSAARINIHLHQQLFFGDDDGLYETDEEWTD